LLELFQKTSWRQFLLSFNGIGNDNGHSLIDYAIAYTTSKRQILRDITRYEDAAIAYARLPYATAGVEPLLPHNYFARMLVPVCGRAREKDAECQTKNELLMLEFALHAYRLEHDSYPATLQKLTSTYLNTVPFDPFGAAGETLHYQRSAQGYTLYSDGVNGKDDHGAIDDTVVKNHR